jgi:hypothetical protein
VPLVDQVFLPEVWHVLVGGVALGNGTLKVDWLVLFGLHALNRYRKTVLIIEIFRLLA